MIQDDQQAAKDRCIQAAKDHFGSDKDNGFIEVAAASLFISEQLGAALARIDALEKRIRLHVHRTGIE